VSSTQSFCLSRNDAASASSLVTFPSSSTGAYLSWISATTVLVRLRVIWRFHMWPEKKMKKISTSHATVEVPSLADVSRPKTLRKMTMPTMLHAERMK